jgi:ABC-2 type transport system permease protein
MTGSSTLHAWFLAAGTLWRREVVRFLRQRSRVIGALLTPVVFWLLIGSGLGSSFRLPGQTTEVDYLEYFFPGTTMLIVLFTAIFATISVIEDRREGFLQAVLAAPVARSAIVMGKVMGSTTLALVQAMAFLLLAPLAGVPISALSLLAAGGLLTVSAVGLSALGLLIAWRMDSTQGFHAIMNLFLIPMWLLSGALFPAAGASVWVRWLVAVNPLTYGVAGLRHALYADTAMLADLPPLGLCIAVTAGFALAMSALVTKAVTREA